MQEGTNLVNKEFEVVNFVVVEPEAFEVGQIGELDVCVEPVVVQDQGAQVCQWLERLELRQLVVGQVQRHGARVSHFHWNSLESPECQAQHLPALVIRLTRLALLVLLASSKHPVIQTKTTNNTQKKK